MASLWPGGRHAQPWLARPAAAPRRCPRYKRACIRAFSSTGLLILLEEGIRIGPRAGRAGRGSKQVLDSAGSTLALSVLRWRCRRCAMRPVRRCVGRLGVCAVASQFEKFVLDCPEDQEKRVSRFERIAISSLERGGFGVEPGCPGIWYVRTKSAHASGRRERTTCKGCSQRKLIAV